MLSGSFRALPFFCSSGQVAPASNGCSLVCCSSSSNSAEWRGCLVDGVGGCPGQSVRERGDGRRQESWPQERAQHVHGEFGVCFETNPRRCYCCTPLQQSLHDTYTKLTRRSKYACVCDCHLSPVQLLLLNCLQCRPASGLGLESRVCVCSCARVCVFVCLSDEDTSV